MADRERLSDEEAYTVFSRLFDASFSDVLSYCRRRCRNQQDAEDAASETYLIAWRRLEDLAAAESSVAWLYGVAYRVLANQRRGRDRFDRLVVRVSSLVPARRPPDPADAAVADAAIRDVYAALGALSRFDRELILLATLEGLPHADIGMVLDLPVRVVRGRLYRARERLYAKVLEAQGAKHLHLDTSGRDGKGGRAANEKEAP